MKRLLFLLLIIPFNLFSQYYWQGLTNAPKSWRNDDIYFLNANMGWAIHGSYQYYSNKQFAQVYGTKDGGNTWQLLKDSSKSFFRAVGFADSLTGWVGNLADTNNYGGAFYTHDTVPLYQTNDGGKTWTPANLPNPHPIGICGISVVNDSVVYAYGRWNSKMWNNNVGFVKTTNKGKTWVYHDMSAYFYGMVDGWFFNQDTGFLTGASTTYKAQILETFDGGNTWQVSYCSTRKDTDEVWKIFFPSRDTGYASIEFQAFDNTKQKNRYLVKTINAGNTWTEMPFVGPYDEEGIGFINDTVGWIGGDECWYTYITFDGGNTWAPDNGFGIASPPYQNCSDSYVMNRFRKINDTLMYACGNTVYKLSGKTTAINDLKKRVQNVENYPNPYSSATVIKYELSQACHNVKIDVYTASGQLIYSENLGAQSGGIHNYIFNKNVYSGAYYYTITSDEYVITREMIKVK